MKEIVVLSDDADDIPPIPPNIDQDALNKHIVEFKQFVLKQADEMIRTASMNIQNVERKPLWKEWTKMLGDVDIDNQLEMSDNKEDDDDDDITENIVTNPGLQSLAAKIEAFQTRWKRNIVINQGSGDNDDNVVNQGSGDNDDDDDMMNIS